ALLPTLATCAHAAHSPAAAVEPAVIADTEAHRRDWVSKAAAGMAATIQLTHAETSLLVVAWYRRVVELEKGFLPHDNC
ncbi:hypothetical protein FIBSPDRAFT_857760, partial [Athelia psychrophila]